MSKDRCLEILKARLIDTQNELDNETCYPNYPNKKDHVYQIIVGAGNHSQGPAVLKYAVPVWLGEHHYDFISDQAQGQFLVHL